MKRSPSTQRPLFVALFSALLLALLGTAWLPQRIYLSVCQCGIFLLCAAWLPRMLRRNIPFTVPPAVAVLAAVPCLGLLQLATKTAAYPWKTALSTLDWAAVAAAGWLAAQLAANENFTVPFRRVLIFSGVLVSLLGALHWYTSPGLIFWTWPNPYQLRVTVPILNHSHFAAFLELALAPAIWAALRAPKATLSHAWAAAVIVCAVWITGSRSGSVIVLAELAGVLLLSARLLPARSVPWRRILAIAGPAVVLVAAIGSEGIAARLAEPARDDLRPLFARAALGMIRDRPLTGFGLGSFSTVYPAYEPTDVGLYVEHAHNDWLEWTAEGGLLLPALLLTLALFALRQSFAAPWMLGCVAVFAQAAAEFPLHNPAVTIWFFVCLCAALNRVPGPFAETSKYH